VRPVSELAGARTGVGAPSGPPAATSAAENNSTRLPGELRPTERRAHCRQETTVHASFASFRAL